MTEYEKGFADGRVDAVEDFVSFLTDSYDKGMRMSAALAKTNEEKRTILSIYKDFIDSLPLNVAAFRQFEEGKK